jgi:hypothetical protein
LKIFTLGHRTREGTAWRTRVKMTTCSCMYEPNTHSTCERRAEKRQFASSKATVPLAESCRQRPFCILSPSGHTLPTAQRRLDTLRDMAKYPIGRCFVQGWTCCIFTAFNLAPNTLACGTNYSRTAVSTFIVFDTIRSLLLIRVFDSGYSFFLGGLGESSWSLKEEEGSGIGEGVR